MKINVVTIFPEMFAPTLEAGVVGRARRARLVEVEVRDLREHTADKRRTVDDAPFGGGPGMVMAPGPFFAAVESLAPPPGSPIVLLSPQGQVFTQAHAERLAQEQTLTLLCGRYEGVDERVAQHLTTMELSVGDYVVSGGEIPALLVIDAVTRLLPGAVGRGEEAVGDDSHTSGLLQHPQYTRPPEFRGYAVPEVLLSGDHAAIARWRREQSLRRTQQRRPDLLAAADLTAEERVLMREEG